MDRRPLPPHRADLIDGRLWVGGLAGTDRPDRPERFDTAWSLSRVADRLAPPNAAVTHRAFLREGPLTRHTAAAAHRLAAAVTADLDAGRHVLLRCAAGQNRSAFVAALVLTAAGHPAADAIDLLRTRRHTTVLNNPWMVRWLLTHQPTCR